MKSIQFRRNLTIILSTLFVVALIYILYIQVYTRAREEKLIQTRFRVLDQMGENLQAKMELYKKNVETYRLEVKGSLRNIDSLKKIYNNIIDQDKLEEWDDYLILLKMQYPQLSDSINDIRAMIKSRRSTDQKEISQDKEDLKANILSKEKALQDTLNNYSNVYNSDLFLILKSWELGSLMYEKDTSSRIQVREDSILISSASLEFHLDSDLLLNNIDRKDVFAQTLVIANSSIIYNSLKEDLQLVILDESEERTKDKGFHLFSGINSDTLFLPVNGEVHAATIHSNRCYDIQLSDGMYKLFLKPVKIDRMDWFIGGMVRSAEFEREKRSIAPWFVIVLIIILMIILLSIPFIKLKVISKTEMLGADMIIKTAFSLLLGTSLIILFLFFQANNLSQGNEIDNNIKNLSDNIQSAFREELKCISSQISEYDRHLKTLANTQEGSNYKKRLNKLNINEIQVLDTKSRWNPTEYKYFDYINWLDGKGMQTAQLSQFSSKEKMQNVSFRDYFKKHDQWVYTLDNLDTFNFVVESIVSVKSGDYKAAFSRKSLMDSIVVVLTGRFYSLFDPILPKDYKFCIIDATGEVWFHSNKYQNKAENFIKECGDNKLLKAAIYAQIPKLMNVQYYDDPFRIFIRPMKGLPLYLVTMHDTNTTRTYQFQVFVTTMLLICALFSFIFLGAFLFIFIKRIYESDKRWSFLIEYTRPRIHHKTNYFKMSIILCLWFVPFIIIWFMNNASATLSIFVLVSFLIISLVLQIHKFKTWNWRMVFYSFTLGIVTLALMIVSFFIKGDDWLSLSLSYILIIALFGLIVSAPGNKHLNTITEKITDKFGGLSYIHAYTIFIFLMIVLLGAAPVVKFFHIAVELENDIDIRHKQYEIYKARETRNDELRKHYSRIHNPPLGIHEQKNRQDLGIYNEFWGTAKFAILADGSFIDWRSTSLETSLSAIPDTLINKFRPSFDDLSIENKFILFDHFESRDFYWETTRDSIIFKYKSWIEDSNRKAIKYGKIATITPRAGIILPFHGSHHFKYPIFFNGLFILLIFIILLAFLWLIFFAVKKIFVASLTEEFEFLDFRSRVRQQLVFSKKLVLVRLSGVTGFDHLVSDLKKEFNVQEIQFGLPALSSDLKNVATSEAPATERHQTGNHPIKPWIWLIREPDRDFYDPQDFLQKMNEIKIRILKEDFIVILLQNSPDSILRYYEDKTSGNSGKDNRDLNMDDATKARYQSAVSFFRELLNDFTVLTIPVKSETVLIPDEVGELAVEKSFTSVKLIEEELSVSDYLTGLKESMINYLKHLEPQNLQQNQVKKLLLTHITELAGKYYQDLFNACTPEEKFVLFDLSHDMIVNDKNRDSMRALWIKGLLVRRNGLIMIMNRSFCNYIRNIHTPEEKQTVKKAMGGEAGRWKGYRIALIMIIAALLVFLFLSNQDFLTNINKLITIVVASLTGITTIFNLTSQKNKT